VRLLLHHAHALLHTAHLNGRLEVAHVRLSGGMTRRRRMLRLLRLLLLLLLLLLRMRRWVLTNSHLPVMLRRLLWLLLRLLLLLWLWLLLRMRLVGHAHG